LQPICRLKSSETARRSPRIDRVALRPVPVHPDRRAGKRLAGADDPPVRHDNLRFPHLRLAATRSGRAVTAGREKEVRPQIGQGDRSGESPRQRDKSKDRFNKIHRHAALN
jgi:hypothetical protein